MASAYNATVYRVNHHFKYVSAFVAQVQDGVMLRSNSIQCTGHEGSAEYDAYMRRVDSDCEFIIRMDNCQGYASFIGSGINYENYSQRLKK